MRNKKKLLLLLGLAAVMMLVLSGCANQYQNPKVPTGFFYGSIYKYLAIPIQKLIVWFGQLVGGSNGFGWGVIFITLIVRLILLPLMLHQTQKSTRQTEKMKAVKPQIDMIQKARANASTAQAAQLSQLTMDVYKKNNLSMTGGIGCLPLLLQLPIFAGLYQAVQYSPQIAKQAFFGIPLGKPSIVIAIIATLFYVGQSVLSMVGIPADQRKQMMTMMVVGPGMTLFISLVAPAALALYFLASGIMALVQQVITTYVIMPKIKVDVDRELKETPIVTVIDEEMLAKMTQASAPANGGTASVKGVESQATQQSNRSRNAGKQQRRPK